MSELRTVELASVPPLGASLRRGVVGSAVAAARRQHLAGPLPGVRLAARGLTADPVRLTDYQHLVGAVAADVLPAGFVHVLAFPVTTALMVRDDFPLPLLGMVHLANTVTQRRPVRLGEVVDVTVHAERLAAHHRGVSVDLVAQASVAGEVVWQRRVDLPGQGVPDAGWRAGRARRAARVACAVADRGLAAAGRPRPAVRRGVRRPQPDPHLHPGRQGVRLPAHDRPRHVHRGARAGRDRRAATRSPGPRSSSRRSRCPAPPRCGWRRTATPGRWTPGASASTCTSRSPPVRFGATV